ncbi:uncharacterized protein DFL_003079 [Arthrobotrys flagrans]|uniref:F-box domain-containing protein n=1 Tax=Arthrobotrys flagrans TaxID=97331 RepID=A0A437ACR0_ARTFL|nr:hypothetical protein DFL_003079 [Arthrobotrys flagrans]
MSTTPPLLRLPYELHEKIALSLTTAADTLSLTNTCTLLRQTLKSSNKLWYRLLHLSGSVEHEYDAYIPGRDYFKRVVRIRQGRRLRCQSCLGREGVRTVDCHIGGGGDCHPRNFDFGGGGREGEKTVAFFGVWCGECLGERFYDIASFESMQDIFWEGIVNPPLLRLPKWLVCKTLSEQYTNRYAPPSKSTNPFSTNQNPILSIPKSDAIALTDATTDDEATDEVLKRISRRNEKLAELTKRTKLQERKYVLDCMVEAYEDFYGDLHRETPVHVFEMWWEREVFGIERDAEGKEVVVGRNLRDPVGGYVAWCWTGVQDFDEREYEAWR